MNHPYSTYTDKDYITSRLTQIDWSKVPDTFKFKIETIPVRCNRWHVLREGQWVLQDLNVGTIVVDVETCCSNQYLALASAYHLEDHDIYAWVSSTIDMNSKQTLLDIPAGSLVISHRACFESSFFTGDHSPTTPSWANLCTFALASSVYHPKSPALIRAIGRVGEYAHSNDCSLAGLYEMFSGGVCLEKGFQRRFIDSDKQSWRQRPHEYLDLQNIYDLYRSGKLMKMNQKTKIKKDLAWIPNELVSIKEFPISTPEDGGTWKVSTTKANLERYALLLEQKDIPERTYYWLYQMSCKLKDGLVQPYGVIPYLEWLPLVIKASEATPDRAVEGLLYNIKDVLATAFVMRSLMKIVRKMDEYAFLSIMVKSRPVFFLDPEFKAQVSNIERDWQKSQDSNESFTLKLQSDYASTDSTWDGQDWSPWSKTAKGKEGLPHWFDPSKTKFKGYKTAIVIRLHYKGIPVKRVKQAKPEISEVTGKWYFPKPSLENKARNQFAYVCSPSDYQNCIDLGMTYEEIMAADLIPRPLEHPENTSKEFKAIAVWFSKSIMKYWEDGTITSPYSEVQERIKEMISQAFWTSIRKRVADLRIRNTNYGQAITFLTTVNGAVSGRNTDPFGLVLAKLDEKKAGSELQGLFMAPEGYSIVSYDLDSIQGRAAAILCDAWYALDNQLEKVTLMSTEFSQQIFMGNKKEKSTVAHNLGRMAGFDRDDEKGYMIGKNCQFSLIFGVGAKKLSKMISLPEDTTKDIVTGFKGEQDYETKIYSGGTASGLFNMQNYMRAGWFPNGDGTYSRSYGMKSTVSGRVMPNILDQGVSGDNFITTKGNASIQSADVDIMNYVLVESERRLDNSQFRYAHSVHDAFIWTVKNEYVSEFISGQREIHCEIITTFLNKWNVDLEHAKKVLPNIFYPETIDVTRRWVKAPKDEVEGWTVTMPNGYSKSLAPLPATSNEDSEGDSVDIMDSVDILDNPDDLIFDPDNYEWGRDADDDGELDD